MFKPILKNLVEQTPGAQSAILMGCDGISVDHFTADVTVEEDGQSIAVEFAAVVTEVSHAASLLKVGGLDEIAVRCGNLSILLSMLTKEYFVALLVDRDGNAAKGRYLLRRDAHLLRAALD